MTVPDTLSDAPTSAKLVYYVLACHGRPLPPSAIRREAKLPDSTLMHALDELERRDAIDRDINPDDGRSSLVAAAE